MGHKMNYEVLVVSLPKIDAVIFFLTIKMLQKHSHTHRLVYTCLSGTLGVGPLSLQIYLFC